MSKKLAKRPTLIFGIDPAFRQNGFAMSCLDLQKKDIGFKVFKDGFLGFCSWFLHEVPDDIDIIFSVENSNKQNTTFDMSGNKRVIASKSRNVGKNQAVSQCVVDLVKTKYPVLDLSPKQKGRKWTLDGFLFQLKINKIQRIDSKKLTQDCIDAGQLAIIGMNRWYESKK